MKGSHDNVGELFEMIRAKYFSYMNRQGENQVTGEWEMTAI